MAIRNDFAPGEVLAAADLNDTFASKPTKTVGTTAPGSPATGDLWYDTNTTPPTAKFYDGTSWQTFSAGAADFSNAASGTYTDGGINYKYLTFTASGTLTVTKAGFADVLVVGGGGSGGSGYGGGGGAGGYLEGQVLLPVGSLSVVVGAGGSFTNLEFGAGRNGVSSYISPFYVAAGGGAGGASADIRSPGEPGGSGGGGGGGSGVAGSGGAGGTGVAITGNDGGGAAGDGIRGAGGGGGRNAAGVTGTSSLGGNGGAGLASSITGTSVTYAGGGGGGSGTGTAGTGGAGGGGNGTNSNAAAAAGTANTGGGGGGGGRLNNNSTGGRGGNGGSGVVIIRVRT